MTIATVREDMVTGRGTGMAGVPLPDELAALPLERLRYSGGQIVDAAGITAWHIDAAGAKRLAPGDGRQPLTCAWDAVLVHDGTAWRVRTAADDLIAYAHALQWRLAESGLTVDCGGTPVRFPTDGIGRGLLNGAATRALAPNPPASFRWQTGATTFITLTAAQVVTAGSAVHDYVQGTFDVLDDVVADILSGTITSTAQIDAAQWPANS